jgi:hypothetical protein
MSIIKKLSAIQTALNAPKGQFNSFGKYSYRNCEDILQALKPHLKATETALLLSDQIVEISGRFYIEATAKLTDGENEVEVKALAREAISKKGMDDSQLTGATSSYARKYALNGLFCIDDNKDADSMNNSETPSIADVKARIAECRSREDLTALWGKMGEQAKAELNKDFADRAAELANG